MNCLRALGLASLLAAIVTATPAAAQRDDPLPRFADPLCPGVMGLKVEAAVTMVARIRDHAEEWGIRLASEQGCEPNMIVAFVDNGQGFLERLNENSSFAFETLSSQERRELLAHQGPVHVLTQVSTRSRDGMVVPRRESLIEPPKTEMWMAHSRIYTPTRQDITSALVLIDRGAIGGMSVSQLADYATMRALVVEHPKLREASDGSASILGLFDVAEADRPAGFTPSDLRFLSALYTGPANLPGSARLAELDREAGDGRTGSE